MFANLDDATIGVVTILSEEFAAACEILDCHALVEVEGRHYRLGTLPRFDRRESHVIVVCCASDMGNSTAAARSAILLRDSRNVRLVIMCGIAGAVPNPGKASDHIRLGDIVVPNRRGVVQYDFVKESERGTKIRPQWQRPSRPILDAAQQLSLGEELGQRPWDAYITRGLAQLNAKSGGNAWRRPTPESDQLREFNGRLKDWVTSLARALPILRGANARYDPIPHPIDDQRIDGIPRVFRGVIASASNLQKNPKRRNVLRDEFGAMAVEMEGAGVGDAAYEADATFFVVRGTCDYCNDDKNDHWHRYAAVAAAAYTRALLEILPAQPRFSVASEQTTKAAANVETVRAAPVHQLPAATGASRIPFESTGVTDTVVQDALGNALDEVLREQTTQHVRAIERAIEVLEFGDAVQQADKLENLLRNASPKLPGDLVKRAYEWLARTAVIKGREDGNVADGVKRAEMFIAKAKNVGTK